MPTSVIEVVEAARHLTPAEQREVIARLWPEQPAQSVNTTWQCLRFSDALQVMAYAPQQEPYVEELRQLLLQGVLARLEHASDNNYEIYGPQRTYYATIARAKEFVGLLSSWPLDRPPREIVLKDEA